ncbi:MAG: c-type cytochrome domain-containing protein, partial [Opitutales bacterium]
MGFPFRLFVLVLLNALVFGELSAAGLESFRKEVEPILTKRCYRCHGPEKQKGKIRLDQLDPDLLKGNSAETWHDALNMLNRGEMPPEDEPQLSTEERRKLVGWLTKELRRVAQARRSAGGQVVLRRLNRYEYGNTMRDLLGMNFDFAR